MLGCVFVVYNLSLCDRMSKFWIFVYIYVPLSISLCDNSVITGTGSITGFLTMIILVSKRAKNRYTGSHHIKDDKCYIYTQNFDILTLNIKQEKGSIRKQFLLFLNYFNTNMFKDIIQLYIYRNMENIEESVRKAYVSGSN